LAGRNVNKNGQILCFAGKDSVERYWKEIYSPAIPFALGFAPAMMQMPSKEEQGLHHFAIE